MGEGVSPATTTAVGVAEEPLSPSTFAAQVPGRLVAVVGILLEEALDNGGEIGIEGAEAREVRRAVALVHAHDGGGGGPLEGDVPEQGLVQQDAQGVEIAAGVGAAVDGLRGGVGDGAEEGAGLGLAGGVEGAGDAEVGDLDAAVEAEEDVAGLHVAVDDVLGMGFFEGEGDGFGDAADFEGREALPALEAVLEGLAFDELHGEVVRAFGLTGLVDADDVGVLEAGGEAGFLLEAADVVELVGAIVVEDLEGDEAAVTGVACAVDGGHAAGAEPGD